MEIGFLREVYLILCSMFPICSVFFLSFSFSVSLVWIGLSLVDRKINYVRAYGDGYVSLVHFNLNYTCRLLFYKHFSVFFCSS